MMEKIEIIIREKKYNIACRAEELGRLAFAAKKLNARIARMEKKLNNVDDKALLMMAALVAEDELEKKENLLEDDGEKIDSNDLCDALAENMEDVTSHLEDLIEKIKSY